MEEKYAPDWGTRSRYLMAVLTQTLGINTYVSLPYIAVKSGGLGYVICIFFTYILLGIPLLYMEYVIGQYTARDCLEIWSARPCFSHFGYIYILWQIIFLLYSQTVNSFILHYFLITFEKPIPYYFCGDWSKNNCNILTYNYTVNQDCIRQKKPLNYCANLYTTFPECQYWRYNILAEDTPGFQITWRVGLASGIICAFTCVSCCKRIQSLKCILPYIILYPISGYALFSMGSMLQKGMVVKFEEAMDSDFTVFFNKFNFSGMVAQVLYALNIGTGISFNLASSASFRTPTFSNSVVAAVAGVGVFTLAVCTNAMMNCPYAFKYSIDARFILQFNMGRIFEKMTLLLHEYNHKFLWLILVLSCFSTMLTGLNCIYIWGLLEMLVKRYPKVGMYPCLVTVVGLIALFFVTIPLLGGVSLNIVVQLKRTFNVIVIFLAMLETGVFILWYGIKRFCEDVHFMQGTQPKNCVRIVWIISTVLLAYVFVSETRKLYHSRQVSIGTEIGWWFLIATILWAVLVLIIKILVSLYCNTFKEVVSLDPTWGPRSEVVKRSRAMFSAQAMTKEYMYRQYHLQAGILARQKQANIRSSGDVTI